MNFKQMHFWVLLLDDLPGKSRSIVAALLALFLVVSPGFAQDSMPGRAPALPKDSSVTQHQPKEPAYWKPEHFKNIPVAQRAEVHTIIGFDRIKKKYATPEFNYSQQALNRFSWWDRLKRRVNEFLKSILPDWSISSTTLVLRILAILGIGALIFVIYKLIASGKKAFIREKKEPGESPVDFIERNLETTDIQAYLEDALEQRNYTLALRYLHLINLQALVRKTIIEWDYRKTNHDFLAEIKSDVLRAAFEKTITVYEYVWFGNFAIDEQQFKEYQELFIHFKNQVG